jgi:hypothetical protein
MADWASQSGNIPPINSGLSYCNITRSMEALVRKYKTVRLAKATNRSNHGIGFVPINACTIDMDK